MPVEHSLPLLQRTVVEESSFLLEYQPVPTFAHLLQVGVTSNQEWGSDWIEQSIYSLPLDELIGWWGESREPRQYRETQLSEKILYLPDLKLVE